MQKLFWLFFIATLMQGNGFKGSKPNNDACVNKILGDISFVERFGKAPTAETDEDLRIVTHLQYVEEKLRQKDVSTWPAALANKRKQILDWLHQYWVAGVFPRNYDYSGRKPCFIDKEGRICAVGYLVEKTKGRKAAEAINNLHQYDEILAMNDKTVDEWIAGSGLTPQECAMIQPSYGPVSTSPEASNAQVLASSAFCGLNAALNVININHVAKGSNNRTVGIAGLATGVGQMVFGLVMYPYKTDGYYFNVRSDRKTFASINIALGSATMLLSAWNLISNKKPRNHKLSWNVQHFIAPDNNNGTGLAFRYKL